MRIAVHQVLAVVVLLAAAPISAFAEAVVADKVVITNTGATSAFHLSEVQVFEQGSATNVAASAAGASATASSTGWGTQPAWTIDGNTDGAFGSNSVWHDLDGEAGDDPTQVDMLTINFAGLKTVDLFDVWGRSDCCGDRDDSFSVAFYNGNDLVGYNDSGILVGSNTGRTAIMAVPEPSTITMLIGGVLLLFRRRRA